MTNATPGEATGARGEGTVSTHMIATRISDAYPGLGFSAALALTRLVRTHAGGPVPTRGKKAPFQRADVAALAKAGLVVLHGDATVPVTTQVRSLRDYRPGTVCGAGGGPGWSATIKTVTDPEKRRWFAGVSPEGAALVDEQEAMLSQDASRASHPGAPKGTEPRGVPVPETFEMFGQSLFGSVDVDDASDDLGEEQDGAGVGLDDEDETPSFSDLEDIASSVFNIWRGGSEVEWARFAWAALHRAGLTDYTDEVERTLVVCRLLVLAGLNREFASRAHDEGYPGEWHEYVIYDAIGAAPRINEVALGRLAERLNVGDPGEPGCELPTSHELVRDVVLHEWRTVAKALIDELGANFVMATLWLNRRSETVYPPLDEDYHEAVNSDEYDGGKQQANSWILQGMPPDGD